MEAVCVCGGGVMQRDESGFLLVMEAVWEGVQRNEWVWVSQRRKQWRMIAKTEGKADKMG